MIVAITNQRLSPNLRKLGLRFCPAAMVSLQAQVRPKRMAEGKCVLARVLTERNMARRIIDKLLVIAALYAPCFGGGGQRVAQAATNHARVSAESLRFALVGSGEDDRGTTGVPVWGKAQHNGPLVPLCGLGLPWYSSSGLRRGGPTRRWEENFCEPVLLPLVKSHQV